MMMHFLTLNYPLRHFIYPKAEVMYLEAFHIIEAFIRVPCITCRHLASFCYLKGKVEAHLEECSIDLVLCCYFNVHHWKMSSLKGTQREEVTLGMYLHLSLHVFGEEHLFWDVVL
jgi:hypothetical protein